MLYTILIILIWVGIGLFVWIIGFWIYGMITDKDFREANFESAREAERKRKRRKAARRDLERKRFGNYYRTGNRRYLYDDDFNG